MGEFLFYIGCIYLVFIMINFLFTLCITIILDGLKLLYEMLFKNTKNVSKYKKKRKKQ